MTVFMQGRLKQSMPVILALEKLRQEVQEIQKFKVCIYHLIPQRIEGRKITLSSRPNGAMKLKIK